MEEGTWNYFSCASQLIHHTNTLYAHIIIERGGERRERERKEERGRRGDRELGAQLKLVEAIVKLQKTWEKR